MSGETRLGDFRAVCDRSGFQCWNSELVTEWTGLRVLRRFAEARHPQDFVKGVRDDPSVKNARPEQPDTFLASPIEDDLGRPLIASDGQPIFATS